MKKLVEMSNKLVDYIIYIFGVEEDDRSSDIFLKVTVPLLMCIWLFIIITGAMLVFCGYGFSYGFTEFLERAITISFVLIMICGIVIVVTDREE